MDIGYFLKLMTEKNASDMFLTTGAPVNIKVEGKLLPLGNTGLPAGMVEEDRVLADGRGPGRRCSNATSS
jgi:twitching motility protein PilU